MVSPIDWRSHAEFRQAAEQSMTDTVNWMNARSDSAAVIETLEEFTNYLFLAMVATSSDDGKVDMMAIAGSVAHFVMHLIQDHGLEPGHVSTAIDMMTFYCARMYHTLQATPDAD
jgi:uncharacterized membrane protein YebE (DUF533 family)